MAMNLKAQNFLCNSYEKETLYGKLCMCYQWICVHSNYKLERCLHVL